MTDNYKTHWVVAEDIECLECSAPLPIGAKFCVVCTPSKPYRNLCLTCTDTIMHSGEKGVWVDPTES